MFGVFLRTSQIVCDMFAKQGAQGCYSSVTHKILPKSEKTSQQLCKGEIESWYSFENIQKMFKIPCVYGDQQNTPTHHPYPAPSVR